MTICTASTPPVCATMRGCTAAETVPGSATFMLETYRINAGVQSGPPLRRARFNLSALLTMLRSRP